jgi:two-component system chemotaxis response regulator CheB
MDLLPFENKINLERFPRAIIIGSSTGGPAALLQIFENLSPDVAADFYVAQHMPNAFMTDFVKRLRNQTALSIELAEHGTLVETGAVYFAPGGNDTEVIVTPSGAHQLAISPSATFLSPSIDRLMISAAKVYGENCLGIVLTGMGSDSVAGMEAIKQAGGKTIIQDQKTSAVYGMAQAVNAARFADEILPLNEIPLSIANWSQIYAH